MIYKATLALAVTKVNGVGLLAPGIDDLWTLLGGPVAVSGGLQAVFQFSSGHRVSTQRSTTPVIGIEDRYLYPMNVWILLYEALTLSEASWNDGFAEALAATGRSFSDSDGAPP